jgi:hypothetical protein
MRKQISFVSAVLMVVITCVVACSKSGSKPTTPPVVVTCDTANMKYAADVLPILQANCYECHGNGNSLGGIVLDNYASLKSHAVSGEIKGAITHASGYVGMPYLRTQLDTCTINKIIDWIAQGAPNN